MSSVIADIAYGHRVASANDPYPKIAERVTEILFGAGTPGLNSVDILPIRELLQSPFMCTRTCLIASKLQSCTFPSGFQGRG